MESLMTSTDLAKYLRVDRVTIYRYLKENKIPALRTTNRWRFRKDEIDKWMIAQAGRSGKGA